MIWTVGELARQAGVSVRTLHHWDEVGLLVPSARTAAGHRRYDGADLARLQRALGYRELGLGLADVARLLDDPDVDHLSHLRRQHALLVDRAARLLEVAAAVARAMEARRMGIHLDPAEVRKAFGEHDPTEHAAEAQARWGQTEAYAQSQRRTSSYGVADWKRIRDAQADLEQRFAQALAEGAPAGGPRARALAEEHRVAIDRSFYDCPHAVHRDLADLYVSDERFAAHYEQVAPGLAHYVRDAVHANADAPPPVEAPV